MRRVPALVLQLQISLLAHALGVAPAKSWAAQVEYPIVLTNAYGDTAFVDSIKVWRQRRSIMLHVAGTSRDTVARNADGHPMFTETLCDSWTIRGSTRGTMAAILSLPTVSASASEIVADVVSRWPDLGRLPDDSHPSVVIELGSYPATPGSPRTMGVGPRCYDTRFPRLRVTYFVFGRPDSTALTDERRVAGQEEWVWKRGDPTPIRVVDQVRPYDVTGEEVAATARVVGDVLVDLAARTVRTR